MISEDVIQKVKDENDIVDVISESVKLKRSGRNYIGLCPFHHEKTPSFSVSQDKQIYKCFGCGEAGNVITFTMKIRNLSFPEAVKLLADRVNIDIDFYRNENKSRKNSFEKLYKLNVEAARYFFSCLNKNETAKSYLLNRGITVKTIRKFGLGYSVDSWNAMLKYLKEKGFTELDMLSDGLIIKSQKGNYYDRFRNRVIFPVFNYSGKVIGFGGRVLNDSKPKYLNSPETSLFKKGTNLYGLNFAIKNNSSRMFIMVEGYMDCISLHQYGITNTVASLGTALTAGQAKLMKRYVDKVIISYDADTAGQMATLRSLNILKNAGLDVRVLLIPEGKDPDEFIRNNGKDAFITLISNALPLIDYRIQSVRKEFESKSPDNTIKYVDRVLEILIDLDPIEREMYIKKLSEETGIRIQALYDMLNGNIRKNTKKVENMNTEEDFGQKLYLEPAYLKAERAMLKLMLDDDHAMEYAQKFIGVEEILLESHRKIYKYIIESSNYDRDDKIKHIESKCRDVDISKEWVNILDTEIIFDNYDYKYMINSFIEKIKKHRLEQEKRNIITKIKKCEKEGKLDESLKLAQELIKIQRRIGEVQ
ncbi:DNA primase [Clostridium algifaecis]|uniref:DNA primase n=1 Tax=Clostridium algifaecis TaxID=1472040 RepID=A0ABS4KSP0_9CLOT|nr:DNA primase [Clostridium algifaecis]